MSFVKDQNILLDRLVLKVFNDKCSNLPIYEGSDFLIGEYSGAPLILGNHQPFKTALYAHSLQAYFKSQMSDDHFPEFIIAPQKSKNFYLGVQQYTELLRKSLVEDEEVKEEKREENEKKETEEEIKNEKFSIENDKTKDEK